MSRLTDILENHENLEQLFSIMKHYGVNAEYISNALIEHFDQKSSEDADSQEDSPEQSAELSDSEALVEDLKQFVARF